MERVWQELEEHLKEYIIPSLMTLFQTMFGYVNDEVSGIASDVAMTPSAFSPSVFGMVRNVSEKCDNADCRHNTDVCCVL